MSRKPLVPNAKPELDKMKMEVAGELGLNPNTEIQNAYLGDMSTKDAGLMAGYKNVGNVGGEMVRRMINQAETELAKREKSKKL